MEEIQKEWWEGYRIHRQDQDALRLLSKSRSVSLIIFLNHREAVILLDHLAQKTGTVLTTLTRKF